MHQRGVATLALGVNDGALRANRTFYRWMHACGVLAWQRMATLRGCHFLNLLLSFRC